CCVLLGISGEIAVTRESDFTDELLGSLSCALACYNLLPYVIDERALRAQRLYRPRIAVARNYRPDAPRRHLVQRPNPVCVVRIAVCHVVARSPVDAEVAGEQNPLAWQICYCITDGVCGAHAP